MPMRSDLFVKLNINPILSPLQLQTKQVTMSEIRSHIKYLIQTYYIMMLML